MKNLTTFKEQFAEIVCAAGKRQYEHQGHHGDYETIKEVTQGRELILYGAGGGAYPVVSHLNQYVIPFHGICDTYRTGIFSFTSHTILTPAELAEKHADAYVLITSEDYQDEIFDNLLKLGFTAGQLLRFPRWPRFPRPRIAVDDFIRDHYDGYAWAYGFLQEEQSRSLLVDIVRMYILGDSISRFHNSVKYFDTDIIQLQHGEVFVDGGAFCGDSTLLFLRQCKNAGVRHKMVYAFEPESLNYQAACTELSRFPNISVVAKGLWNKETELTFNRTPGGTSSSMVLDKRGEKIIVPVTSLDIFFENKPFEDLPTFIKMDIEGAEQEALKGTKEILNTKKPKLALCVYHLPDDPYEIMRIVHECNPDYRMVLRQPFDGFSETLLYAV